METIADVVDRLQIAGLEAASAAGDLNAPGALVTPAALLPPTKMCGSGRVRALVELVARDAGDDAALTQLQALYTTARTVLSSELVPDAEAPFTRRVLPGDPTGLPALRLTIETPTLPDTPTRTGDQR